jgi:SAM-dependent methyltransferase
MRAITATQDVRNKPEWFASWFDSPHYHRLYAHRDGGEAAQFIDRLIECHRLTPGSRVLDLGCGTGRHSSYLASRGFDVTGLDLSAESLWQARLNEGPNLRFVRQDMRLPFRSCAFDHVLNLFTSFGYFEDPADHLPVVGNIAASLKPGGTLVLDYLNAYSANTPAATEEVIEREDTVYRLSRWRDAENIYKRIAIENGHTPLEYVERVARLSLADFRFMFRLYGLTIEETYGDYTLAPFDLAISPRLIIVAGKARRGIDGADRPVAATTGSFGSD